MSSIPMLTAARWRRIENILPQNRRDPVVISAILYREHSGQSLRHAGEAYGISRARLDEWSRALEADGSVTKMMTALKLKAAGPLVRRAGGRPWYHRNQALAAEVVAIKLAEFRQALCMKTRKPIIRLSIPAMEAAGPPHGEDQILKHLAKPTGAMRSCKVSPEIEVART